MIFQMVEKIINILNESLIFYKPIRKLTENIEFLSL